MAPNLAAGLAEFFSLIGGLIFYFVEKRNAYVRFHALQGLYFGALGFVVGAGLSMVMTILAFIPLLGWLLLIAVGFAAWVFGLAFAVVWLIAVINAFTGKEWEIPWIGKIAKRHLAEGKFFFGKSPAP